MDVYAIKFSLRYFIYFILVTTLVFVAYLSSSSPEHYWLIWAGLLFSIISTGETYRARVLVLIMTCVMVSADVLVLSLIANNQWLAGLFIFLITLICVFFSNKVRQYFYVFFLINLFALLAINFPSSISVALERVLLILQGMVIVLVSQMIFFIRFNRNRIFLSWFEMMRNFKDLVKEIFACYVSSDYHNNVFSFEKNIHIQKFRALASLYRAKLMVALFHKKKLKGENILQSELQKIDDIFNIIQDLAQLRHRVSDPSIFAVCREEMLAIEKAILQIFTAATEFNKPAMLRLINDSLSFQIKRLEEIYANVLQVTAQEPLVFLLFIASLQKIKDELIVLAECIGELKVIR